MSCHAVAGRPRPPLQPTCGFIPIRQQSIADVGGPESNASGGGGNVAIARVTAVTPCCRKPLAYVAIYVEGREAGTTGPDGVVELPLTAGRHVLTAPGHSFGTRMSVEIIAGSGGKQDVNLVSSGELFLFLADLGFEDDIKDGIMICTNKGNIPDEAGLFAGVASAPGAGESSLNASGTASATFTPALCLSEGAKCVDVLRNITVEDVDGRRFSPNEDLVEWFEVFEDDCPLAVLSSGTPLRLGYFHGPRETRLGGEAVSASSRKKTQCLSGGPAKMTPASWDVRGSSVRLPKLNRAGLWRPSKIGRPLMGVTLPEASLQKPRLRPSGGALGELDYRLRTLMDIYSTEGGSQETTVKERPAKADLPRAEKLKALSVPRTAPRTPHKFAPEVEQKNSAPIPKLTLRKPRMPGFYAQEHKGKTETQSAPQLPTASSKAKPKATSAKAVPKASRPAPPGGEASPAQGSAAVSPSADDSPAAASPASPAAVSPASPDKHADAAEEAPASAPQSPAAEEAPASAPQNPAAEEAAASAPQSPAAEEAPASALQASSTAGFEDAEAAPEASHGNDDFEDESRMPSPAGARSKSGDEGEFEDESRSGSRSSRRSSRSSRSRSSAGARNDDEFEEDSRPVSRSVTSPAGAAETTGGKAADDDSDGFEDDY